MSELLAEAISLRQTVENHECALKAMDAVNEQLQQRVDELGAALDCACVELRQLRAMHRDDARLALVIDATLNSCESVLLRHGIRTAPQPVITAS